MAKTVFGATRRPTARKRTDGFLKVKEKPNNMGMEHPFNNPENHENLLEYCKDRMEMACQLRDSFAERMAAIDLQLSGFITLAREEQEVQKKNLQGKAPKPVSQAPQVALAHLGRGVTFLASVFSPDGGMFEILTTKDKQDAANALTKKLNDDSVKGRYFRENCKFFLDALKYNVAGFYSEWREEYGLGYKADAGGTQQPQMQRQHAGNYLEALNMYNTFYDPMCNPCDVHRDGEFAGFAEMASPFQFKRDIEKGLYYNTKEVLGGTASSPSGDRWYKEVPQVRIDNNGLSVNGISGTGEVNWTRLFSTAYGSIKGYDSTPGVELLHLFIRLIPTEFGLVPSKTKERQKIEIWKITIANGQKIVATSMMNNMHDYLPFFFCMPIEDSLGMQVKSVGENLAPFQNLISFMLNSFVNATRKNIWDLLIYDPSIVDLSKIGDDVVARVPMTPNGMGKDPKASVFHFNKNLETDKLLTQINEVLQFMEWLFPTRMLQQVADIDRAVKDQVAATVAASQRESWKLAKLIDDQAFSPLRFVLHSNNMQFGDVIEIIDPQTGQLKEVQVTELRGMKLEYAMGEGLKTIDKLSKQLLMKETLNMVLSSGAVGEFNIVDMLDGISSQMGMEMDLTQYRKTEEQKNADAQRQALAKQQAASVAGSTPPTA